MITASLRRATVLLALLGVLGVSQVAVAYPGFHGGVHVGYARGWGWHGGGWGWRGYGCCWFGAGLWLWTLPWNYSTYWWGGVPYYYADNVYYTWNGTTGRYEAVRPPDGIARAPAVPSSIELFMYPKAGQSSEQQAKDRYECHRWAADQTGFDPTQTNGGVSADATAGKRADYVRAQGACLEGRNYSVR